MWSSKKAEEKRQFTEDLKTFNDTGLKKVSILDVKINEHVREEARKLKAEKKAKEGDARNVILYILECINSDICPVCGEGIKGIKCPISPGCWDIMEKCTRCEWQLILSDLPDY